MIFSERLKIQAVISNDTGRTAYGPCSGRRRRTASTGVRLMGSMGRWLGGFEGWILIDGNISRKFLD